MTTIKTQNTQTITTSANYDSKDLQKMFVEVHPQQTFFVNLHSSIFPLSYKFISIG